MRADVSRPGGAQERVDHRVDDGVRIGMPRQTRVVGNGDAPEHQGTVRVEAV